MAEYDTPGKQSAVKPSVEANVCAPQATPGKTTLVEQLYSSQEAPLQIAAPVPGIDLPGFIDHGDGSNLRTAPAEAGGRPVRPMPLAPATRVFVSGTYPGAPDWLYVTAIADGMWARGYVQNFRVTTELPEPGAHLHQIRSGDTVEKLAAREFGGAVQDGQDLRFYENVLLRVNRERGRTGITGTYQDPSLLGNDGNNNIQLVAGQRIWLVSPAYARSQAGAVPDGSATGGAAAKAHRFAGHLQDILDSVTRSPSMLREVAGEYADAIGEHAGEIIGIVCAFIAAEALSAFLAATPTGVGQIGALLIQLILALWGAKGLVEATIGALVHAKQWLTLAWTAGGRPELVAAASKEFLHMLVTLAIAALAYLGMRGNFGKAASIINKLPPGGGAFALALEGAGNAADGAVYEATAIGGPGVAGPLGAGTVQMAATRRPQPGDPPPPQPGGPKLPAGTDPKLAKLIKDILKRACDGAFKRSSGFHAGNHGFPDADILRILTNPDAIYLSPTGRLIFRAGADIVVVEGEVAGTLKGSVITAYGPSGTLGESGAAALGGAATDAGAPVTHEMIVNGLIKTPSGGTMPPAPQVAP